MLTNWFQSLHKGQKARRAHTTQENQVGGLTIRPQDLLWSYSNWACDLSEKYSWSLRWSEIHFSYICLVFWGSWLTAPRPWELSKWLTIRCLCYWGRLCHLPEDGAGWLWSQILITYSGNFQPHPLDLLVGDSGWRLSSHTNSHDF